MPGSSSVVLSQGRGGNMGGKGGNGRAEGVCVSEQCLRTFRVILMPFIAICANHAKRAKRVDGADVREINFWSRKLPNYSHNEPSAV